MHHTVKKIMDIAMNDITGLGGLMFYGFITLFMLVMISFYPGKFYIKLFFSLIVAIVLLYIIVIIIRYFYHKDRPNKEEYRNVIERIDASSFPSIHSARVSILAVIFTAAFDTIPVLVLFVLMGLAVLFSRYYLKKHFFTDILGGVVLGLIIGFAISYFVFW